MGEELRPDRIKAVFTVPEPAGGSQYALHCRMDKANHEIWRRGAIWKLIDPILSAGGRVLITWGEGEGDRKLLWRGSD